MGTTNAIAPIEMGSMDAAYSEAPSFRHRCKVNSKYHAIIVLLERPVPTRFAKPATQVCFPCNDHAQPATPTSHRSVCRPREDHAQPVADKAPTSVTEFLVKLIDYANKGSTQIQ